ncbi:MAG: hypothetical protein CMF55_07020 [Legionellales bacterium]|nr:hypothetical protein [Legionellales bacterium]HAG61370.1 hypothetical protein [Coxiellaceae bacterium]
MHENIKYRIIGLIVLVIIVSLGAPFVWRASETGRPPVVATIDWPSSAVTVSPDVLSNQKAAVNDKLSSHAVLPAQPLVSSDAEDHNLTQPDQSGSAEAALTEAWVIQLATFKQQANAERLVAQLKAQGYQAYFRQQTSQNGVTLNRVYVGPMSDRHDIDQALEALLTENGLRGIPMRAKTGAV